METVICENSLFKINFIQTYDATEDAVSSFYELIKLPETSLGLYETYELAEQAALKMLMDI